MLKEFLIPIKYVLNDYNIIILMKFIKTHHHFNSSHDDEYTCDTKLIAIIRKNQL